MHFIGEQQGMITFRTIRWKNLLSTGNVFTEIRLDKASTTLICGENGAGKTTLLDALTFVLYGKPYRNINLPQLVNTINGKDCLVEIEFGVNGSDYKVVRGQSPKVFVMFKDGKEIEQTANAKDYQHILESQILKMNYKTFCQVVILGSTNYIPFMRLPAADRRNIVENLLDIDVFSKMNDMLKGRLTGAKDSLRTVESDIATLKLRMDAKREFIQKTEEKSDSQLESYAASEREENANLQALVEKKAQIQEEIASLLESVVDVEKRRDSLSQMNALKKQMTTGVKKAQDEKTFYEENADCPVCKSSLSEEFRQDMIGKKASRESELQEALDRMTRMIEESRKELDEKNDILSAIDGKKQESHRTDSAITGAKKYIRQLQELADKTRRDRESLQSERDALSAIERDGDAAEDRRKELVGDMHTMEIAAVLLKDSGIKRKIIRKYIPALNKIINKYLISMDFFAQFTLNEEFTEIIKSRHRDEFSYENFSEGEKLRIDLSLLLAWRDIARMKNCANTNLLILDEVFDSSLDAVGTEEVMKILQSMGSTNNVFVISHKADQLLDKFQNILTFRKSNNFSRIA
jgi:DNA repair exonuclease SbcCD ATPase subunit